MSFDPLLGSTRDKVRAVLGDIQDPPGFSHLSASGTSLVAPLTEALYDSYISIHGAKGAAVVIIGLVLQMLPSKYGDGTTSEDLSSIIDYFNDLKRDIRAGIVDIEGLSGAGVAIAGRVAMTNPDTELFEAL